jgi:NTP pyrophosphatase (non-canonical NTP hydrolase)
MHLDEIQDECYKQAVKSGWTEKNVPIPEMIALIHSEASEALESYRNGEPLSFNDKDGKPQGIASEFADIIIRIGHYSAILGIHIEAEVLRKLKYNSTRKYRHGGKVC